MTDYKPIYLTVMKKPFKFLLFLVFIFAFSNSLFSNSFKNNFEKYINFNHQESTEIFNESNENGRIHSGNNVNQANNAFILKTAVEFNPDTLPKSTFDNSSILSYHLPLTEVKDAEIKIYPNPASEKIFVHFKGWVGEKEIKILDITGRSVFTNKLVDNNYEIDITMYPKGIYLISVKNASDYVVKKIKIQ